MENVALSAVEPIVHAAPPASRSSLWSRGLERAMTAAAFYMRSLAYYRADTRQVIALLAVIGMSTLVGLLMAWPMAVLVDCVLSPDSGKSGFIYRAFLWPLPQSRPGQIVGLALIGFGLKLAQDLLNMLRTILTNHINYNGLVRIRRDLFRKLQSLSLRYHHAQPQGDIVYRLCYDCYGCQTILSVLISTCVAVFTLLVILFMLWGRNPLLTVIALSIAPPLMCANVWFGSRMKQRTLDAKAMESEFTSTIQRSMSTIGLMQAFCREHDEFAQFNNSVIRTIQAWWRSLRLEVSYWLTVGTIFGLGGAAVFGYGGYLVYCDHFISPKPGGMSVGDLMIFVSYLGLLWDPLCKLTGIGPNIQSGVAGAQRVFEVLDREVGICDAPMARSLPVQPRVLKLDRVWFSYSPGNPVLKDVSVTIQPGHSVAFVGSSGVGKSTLLNLLPRFYDPTSGSITLDGHDMRFVRLSDLRQHIALVLQDSILLPTTIAENIAYGRPSATSQEIRDAARLAGADEFIEQLHDGYQTRLSENGHGLSGGQRQRIAIARALLTGSPIIVLDEPTSALDTRHELRITETLKRLKRQRTIILVSHRISTVVHCDRIFMMKDGQIVESGTHQELLALQGSYKKLALRQLRADQ